MKEWVTEIVEDEYCRDDRRFSGWHIAKASRRMQMGKIGEDSNVSEDTVEERGYPQSRSQE